MRTTPFFSIVIPAFNREDFIKDTINSVINQTYTDWECIVVDDGSTDNTEEVIKELILEDDRIHYVFQNNAERSAARNNGIRHASGKYICFLDSDDLFKENHLMDLYNEIKKRFFPKAMFFTSHSIKELNEIERPEVINKLDYKRVIEYLIYNPIIPARVCIHNEILNETKFDEDIVIVEDLLLWLKIAMKYNIFQIEKHTVIYCIHENNSVNIRNNAAIKRLNGLNTFFKRNKEVQLKLTKKQYEFLIGDTHFAVMKYYLFINKRLKAIKHLLLSIFYQKWHHQLKHKLYILICLLLNKQLKEYSQNFSKEF